MKEEELSQFMNFIAYKIQEMEDHAHSSNRIQRYFAWHEYLKNEKYDYPMLQRNGFRVFSMNDQDGIIEEIFRRLAYNNIELSNTFIEFGCDNGIENNTHYLLFKNYQGLWIEANNQHANFINSKFNYYLNNKQLTFLNTFVTKDNIDSILKQFFDKIKKDIDLLVIDLDGNDYYIWEAITSIRPKVICIEYNAAIKPPTSVVCPYSDKYNWDGANIFGASLSALNKLANDKNYVLVGCSVAGTDAFFLDKIIYDKCINDFVRSDDLVKTLYEPAQYSFEYTLGHSSGYKHVLSV